MTEPREKNFWASKTVWVNGLTLLVSLLAALSGSDFISDEHLIYITGLALPIVNVILRFLTNQPVSAPVKDRRLAWLLTAVVLGSGAAAAVAGGPAEKAGLLEGVERVETSLQGARQFLEAAHQEISGPTAGRLVVPSPALQDIVQASPPVTRENAPALAAKKKRTPAPSPRPANMATVFDWECPPQAEPHTLHLFSIETDARFLDPIVRSAQSLDYIVPFGPKVTTVDEDQDGEPDATRLLEYGWTAAPGQYAVEVTTFDPDRGITRHLQKVEFQGKTPDPPPPTGYGLAAKVPAWLATVPAEARKDTPAIKQAMLSLADAASSFSDLGTIKAAFTASLGAVITNGPAWNQFGAGWNQETEALIAAGKIITPADFARALREVGGAL